MEEEQPVPAFSSPLLELLATQPQTQTQRQLLRQEEDQQEEQEHHKQQPATNGANEEDDFLFDDLPEPAPRPALQASSDVDEDNYSPQRQLGRKLGRLKRLAPAGQLQQQIHAYQHQQEGGGEDDPEGGHQPTSKKARTFATALAEVDGETSRDQSNLNESYWDEEDEYARDLNQDDNAAGEGMEMDEVGADGRGFDDAAEGSDNGSDGDQSDGGIDQRESVVLDRIGGQGVCVEAKPLNGVLGKIRLRKQALAEKAQRIVPAAPKEPESKQPSFDFSSLMAKVQAKEAARRHQEGTLKQDSMQQPLQQQQQQMQQLQRPAALKGEQQREPQQGHGAACVGEMGNSFEHKLVVEVHQATADPVVVGAENGDPERPNMQQQQQQQQQQHEQEACQRQERRALEDQQQGAQEEQQQQQQQQQGVQPALSKQPQYAPEPGADHLEVAGEEDEDLEIVPGEELAPGAEKAGVVQHGKEDDDGAKVNHKARPARSQGPTGRLGRMQAQPMGAQQVEDEDDEDDEENGEDNEDEEEVEEEEEEGSGAEEEEEEEDEEEEADVEEEQGNKKEANKEEEPEPELLAYEEDEEGELEDSPQKDDDKQGGASAVSAAMAKAHAKAAAERRARAIAAGQSRFVDMEAELSEDEEGAAASEDEDERGSDGELADLIGTAKEGARDERVRTLLHKQWQEVQDTKDVRQLLHGIQNGFKRPRNGLDGLGDELEGTDAEARRRRAALFGGSALEEEEGNGAQLMEAMGMGMVLELGDAEGEGTNNIGLAAVQKRELRKKLMAAGHSREEAREMAAHSHLSAEAIAATRTSRQASAQQQQPSQGGSQGEEGAGPRHADPEPLSLMAALARNQAWQREDEPKEEAGVTREVRALLTRANSLPNPSTSAPAPVQPKPGIGQQQPKPPKAGAPKPGDLSAMAIRFSMFGRDISNKKGSAEIQGQPSFLGRAASANVALSHRTTASNTGGGARSFVFGSDLSNSHAAGENSKAADTLPGASTAGAAPAARTAGTPSFAGVRGMVGANNQVGASIGGPGAARVQPAPAKQCSTSLFELLGSCTASNGGAGKAKADLSSEMRKLVGGGVGGRR